jgi:YegS/Rv2252/BmrU family lipid kinase
VFVTERRGHARELAAGAVARGARLVIAWGGDGTINEVASALVFGSTPLGIVPSGSGNGLAHALNIPRDPARAIKHAITAAPRPLDAGELGGRLFFNAAGIGLDAHIAACFDRDPAQRRGFSTYVRITARELMAYRCRTYRIESGAESSGLRRALLVTFANSPELGNGAKIAPAARLDDGLLDLVVFEERSRLATLAGVPRLFTGSIARLRGISMQQIERATVESDQPIGFHVDGEPVQGGSRLEARVFPAALKVCA